MSTIIDITAFRRRLPAHLASDGWWLDPPPRVSVPPVVAATHPTDISKREVRQ